MKNYQMMYAFDPEDMYVIFVDAEDVPQAVVIGLNAIEAEHGKVLSTLIGFSLLERSA